MLDIIDSYGLGIAGIFAALLIWWIARRVIPRLRFLTLSRLVYPLLIRHRKWARLTRFHVLLLVLYLIVNGVCMGVGIDKSSMIPGLILRSGMMASVNMIPLFLGGRTNPLVDGLGVPLHVYYLVHHWVGRMVILQSFIHAILAISSQKWRLDAPTISGVVITSALAIILLSSFFFARGILFELVLVMHLLCALTVLGGIVWHVLPFEFWKLIFPTISIGIFSLVTLFRIIRTGPRAYIQSIPESIPDQSIIRFNVKTRGDLKIKPGQFHYLYFSGLRWRYRFQGHPFMVAWCEYEAKGEEKFTNLTFLLQPQRGLTARLINELRLSILRSETITSLPVRFGGPYGQDLHLEKYQTVILVAKGIGIAGVLPYAGYLGRRILHDIEIKNQLTLTSTQSVLQRTLHRDATAKVDLFWELDHNGQEDCVADHLRTLQDQDPGRRTNLIYCYYPHPKTSKPAIKLDVGWKCIYPGDKWLTLSETIEQEARSRRSIVVACGSSTFTESIRYKVLEIMSKENIVEFAEVEYRPQDPSQSLVRLRRPDQQESIQLSHL